VQLRRQKNRAARHSCGVCGEAYTCAACAVDLYVGVCGVCSEAYTEQFERTRCADGRDVQRGAHAAVCVCV